MKSKLNPFEYSHYVTGDSFCNRVQEQAELMKYIQSSQNVLLYSHRRFGKSSLIQQVFRKIKDEKLDIGTIHIDLFGTLSEKDFVIKSFQELSQLESNMDKLLKTIQQTVKSIRLNFSVDSGSGSPSITPSFSSVEESAVLKELMNLLLHYSEKRKLVVAFDEFQEIVEYAEEGFEKRLRSFIQQHENICYIFSGSRQHILNDMFGSGNRAFYQLAESFPLSKIETEAYLPWIKGLFESRQIRLPDDVLENMIQRFDNHPMYIQSFFFHLWDMDQVSELTQEVVNQLEEDIIAKKAIEYAALWDTLTLNQKKTLRLILLNKGKNLFDVNALRSVNLKSGSLVTKALASLIQKEIIVRNGSYEIQDIIFKRWLERTYTLKS